jgi:CelD/BcsL family acetyltransferase involved in cellulose biosynthesis
MVELFAGRLIIERTMAALHRDGVREFDFSVGNYAYKRRFSVMRLPLIDTSAALSWRGWPYGLRDHMVRAVRNDPRLDAWLKRAFGKPLSREEN